MGPEEKRKLTNSMRAINELIGKTLER
jgi:hypothetical protein